MAYSNPILCSAEKCPFEKRIKHIVKKTVPIITWLPWKPVSKYKREPKLVCEKLIGVCKYSIYWNTVKLNPSSIVIPKKKIVYFLLKMDTK